MKNPRLFCSFIPLPTPFVIKALEGKTDPSSVPLRSLVLEGEVNLGGTFGKENEPYLHNCCTLPQCYFMVSLECDGILKEFAGILLLLLM